MKFPYLLQETWTLAKTRTRGHEPIGDGVSTVTRARGFPPGGVRANNHGSCYSHIRTEGFLRDGPTRAEEA
eukprot:5878359-Prymnesium_polylepis.1